MSASIIAKDFLKELLIDVEENLERECTVECCVYRVPRQLRKMNEYAYTPQFVSIGPLHHGKKELAYMEKQKRRYMKSFLEQITMQRRKEIITFIVNEEEHIRNCYAETFELGSPEFIKMILYDAIFIIGLFQRTESPLFSASDILVTVQAITYGLYMDLELLENQLPFFILEKIYQLAFSEGNKPTFRELSCIFFESFVIYNKLPLEVEVKHFTDWKRSALLGSDPTLLSSREKGLIEHLPSAVKLHESGVKFKCIEGDCLLNIRFERRKRRIPCFKASELLLPRLEVFTSTEHLFRNIVAFEQCHYPSESLFCNYIELLDFLIDTEKDVELLVGEGIISNGLGDNASVANMFNKLFQSVHASHSPYYKTCVELKNHFDNPWNRKKATLRRVYFNSLWRGTATFAAILLLLLAVIQTVCSILQVV